MTDIAERTTPQATEVGRVSHWIGGRTVAGESGRSGPVYNPAKGIQTKEVDFASVEEVDAARKPRLGLAEKREVMIVLDLMMAVELGEEELQVAGEPALELRGLAALVEGLLGALADQLIELAEHVVALQPQPRQLAEIGVTLPAFPRILPQKEPELFVEPAGAVDVVIRGGVVHGCRIVGLLRV
jgi:hypothetical protein